ncbi:MAG TPA: Calx-beta domain-containing protein, partial [Planctomycetaceae bacterium]|nr:Calx-beta domain-containing protein [Planctomycetaceae bacterium]
MSSAGDVNGDGFDDLLIGASWADASGNGKSYAGDSYVIFGGAALAATIDLATLGSAGITIFGAAADDHSGVSVSSAGDVNGDGFDDLLIGAYWADASGNAKFSAGDSYVIFGGDFTGAITHQGTAAGDTLTGTAAADVMIGGRGNDTLIGGGGADVLTGGQGNDVLAISDLSFSRVVGGNGFDTLRLDGSGLSLNLTTLRDNRLLGIEQIDLTGSGDNTLTLNQREVLNLSDESNTLIVRRNIGDTVNVGTDWTQGANEVIGPYTFEVFTQGTANLKIQQTGPSAKLSVSQSNGTEGDESQITVTVTNDIPVIGDQYVELAVTGSGISTGDYTLTDDDVSTAGIQILIPDGQTSGSVTFYITDDTLPEGDETATLTIQNPSPSLTLGIVRSRTITIHDNDPLPLVSFSRSNNDVNENAGSVQVGVRLNVVSTKDIDVPFTVGGTAQRPSDYSLPAGFSVTIPAGQLSATFTLAIVDDGNAELTETIQFVMGIPTNAELSTLSGTATTHHVTIRDNDAAMLSFVGSSRTVNEASGSTTLTVALDGTTSAPVSVPILIVNGGTASNPADYSLSTMTLHFPANVPNPTASFNVSVVNDTLSESLETIYFRLGPPQGAVLDSGQSFTLNIADNDRSVVEFGDASRIITASSVSEKVGTAIISLRLTNPSSSAIDVTLRSSGGTATPTSDFGAVPTTIRFNPGERFKTFSVPIIDDSINEMPETIKFEITAATGAEIGTARAHTLTINDNDPLVGIVPTSKEFNAAYQRYQKDYSDAVILNVYRRLGRLPPRPLPELSSYVGTKSLPFVVEGGVTTLVVALSAVTDHPVKVTLKPTGATGDYALSAVSPATLTSAGVLTIPAGAEAATIIVTALNDLIVEKDEALNVAIQSPVGAELWKGYDSRTLWIVDNTPVVRFSESARTVSEGVGTVNVEVQIVKPVSQDVNLTFGLSGSARYYSIPGFFGRDYVPPSTSVRIPAGSTSVLIPIKIINDTNREHDETITLKINSVTGAVLGTQSIYTLTISDNDMPASTVIDMPASTVIASGSGSIQRIPVGTLAISIYDGYLTNSTVFFDANRNGVLDFVDFNGDGLQSEDEPNEPSSMTSDDGAVLLKVDETFDVDGNGIINEIDGIIVAVDGVDTSTGFPLAFPLTGYFNTPGISPLTTLLTGLVEEHDFDVATAAQRVADALNLPTADFIAMDSLAGVRAYNPDAPLVFKTAAMMHNTFTQLATTVSGAASAPPLYVVARAVISDMASRITDEGSTLDLQSRAVIDGLLRGIMVRVGVTLPENVISGAAEVIAAANQLTSGVTIENSDSFLTQIVQSQVVAQGTVADALSAAASGATPISQVVSENTGTALQNQAANATIGVIIPPGLAISDFSILEGDTGTSQIVFTVAISEAPQTTVTVDYATDDLTATAEEGDYIPTSGTLTWLAGDAEPKTITVTINGDTRYEATELLSVILSNVTGAVLWKDIGSGGLINDEPLSVNVPAGSGAGGTGTQETILRLNGEEFELISGGELVAALPSTPSSSITVHGTDAADDSLIVDLRYGNPIPEDGLVFHGGDSGNDSVTIIGGDFQEILQTLSNPTNGDTKFAFADGTSFRTIQWTEMESFLFNVGNVENLVFELPAGVTSAILEDADPSDLIQPGMMQLRSPDGHFKTTVFPAPATSIIIRGGNGADSITIGDLDPAFVGVVRIEGVALGADPVSVTHSGWAPGVDVVVGGINYRTFSKGNAPDLVTLQVPINAAPEGDGVSLVGTTLNVNGTVLADTITVSEGVNLVLTLNGVNYTYNPAQVTVINVHGNSGTDTLTFTGTTGSETATLKPGTLDVTGPNYAVHADSVETVRVYGGGGTNDRAHLYDSAGNDSFVATPTSSYLTGTGFYNSASGFRSV